MLELFGWTDLRQQHFDQHHAGLAPARVVEQQRTFYRVRTSDGERRAEISGRLGFEGGGLPVVGDWVAIATEGDDRAIIHHLLPRQSVFRRRDESGKQQTLCANLDLALIVCALNGDFNMRRVERFLAVAREGGAAPVIVLTKADLCADVDAHAAAAAAVAGGAPVVTISALTGAGLEQLEQHLTPGRTAALLGSSGAGKSTLVNAMTGETTMATQAISGDGKRGRHTTTHRELILLPSGALLLDSPGVRELGVAGADAGLAATFEDVAHIAASCRFSDCGHESEPGCAVQAALSDGTLNAVRWDSYRKLQRELAFEMRRDDPGAQAAHRATWINRAKQYRALKKSRNPKRDGD